MKKDITWAREQINKERDLLNGTRYEKEVDDLTTGILFGLKKALNVINQLDEPEVLSQEWIDEHIDYADVGGDTSVYTCRRLKSLLVPKQELPVIPKYVAEWITNHREKFDLYPALRILENNTLVWGEIYEWYRMNTHKFVNAYLTGEYEVDEEPMYQALIKGHEVADGYDIYWNCDKSDRGVFVSRLHPLDDNFITEMSKEAWNELGIDDSNADLIKVEE